MKKIDLIALLPAILSFALVSSCSNQQSGLEPSIFFDNCECDKVTIERDYEVNTGNGTYKVGIADSSMCSADYPIGQDTTPEGIEMFSCRGKNGTLQIVSPMSVSGSRHSFETMKHELDTSEVVLKSGYVNLAGRSCPYYVVKSPEMAPIRCSVYAFVVDTPNNQAYWLMLNLLRDEGYKQVICKEEPFFTSFDVW